MKHTGISLVLTAGILTLSLATLSAMFPTPAQTAPTIDSADTTTHAARDAGFTGSDHFDWGLLGLAGFRQARSNNTSDYPPSPITEVGSGNRHSD